MIRIVIFEPNQKPYISEVDGSIESLRNSLFKDSPIKLAYKQIKNPETKIVHAEDGLGLRHRQNNHADNIVGAFAVCKYVDNEIVDFNRSENKVNQDELPSGKKRCLRYSVKERDGSLDYERVLQGKF